MLIFDIVSNKRASNRFPYCIVLNKSADDISKHKVLIDTGAEVPVWTGDFDTFEQCCKNIENTHKRVYIGGFGKNGGFADLYKIPEYILSDGNNRIVYHNLLVALLNKDYTFDFIMGFCMIENTELRIDRKKLKTGKYYAIIDNTAEDMYTAASFATVSVNGETFEALTDMRICSADDLNKMNISLNKAASNIIQYT